MAKDSKRMKALRAKADSTRLYTISEAAASVKECATAKFAETVELAFLLGVDPRHADQMVRGAVALPHGTGKVVRVVVFCEQEAQVQAAKDAGADFVGSGDLADKIIAGWTDFDAAVASPDMMKYVGKLGKILGPRGLMPSPKAGTVTPNVGQAVSEIKAGKIEYRVDKNANIHVPVGKVTFTEEQIVENVTSVLEAIVKAKPNACKGVYLKSICMSSTMGPGFRLDAAGLFAQYR